MGISLKIDTFAPTKLLNKPLVYFSLINFDFLLIHTPQLVRSIILQFLSLRTFGFLIFVFLLYLEQ